MKKLLLLTIAIVFALAASGCQKKEAQPTAAGNRKLTVVTTLFPLYDFTRTIAGDKAEIHMLLPPGVEPHGFEPKPQDMVQLSKADVVVYTNELMEPWAVKILKTLANRPEVVDASKGIKLMQAGQGDPEQHGGVDPHIWLDFDNAQVMAQNIADGLSAKDPANREFYQANARGLKDELAKLDQEYRAGLAGCRKKIILEGGHFAFGYLARRYGITYRSSQALNPDAEPTPAKISELVREMRKYGLKYVYCEELLSPATAEMIAKETGARVLLLDAAHNISSDDFKNGTTFVQLMRKNLENLKKGMECNGG